MRGQNNLCSSQHFQCVVFFVLHMRARGYLRGVLGMFVSLYFFLKTFAEIVLKIFSLPRI